MAAASGSQSRLLSLDGRVLNHSSHLTEHRDEHNPAIEHDRTLALTQVKESNPIAMRSTEDRALAQTQLWMRHLSGHRHAYKRMRL